MFSDTKYTKWYFNIIENAKSKQHMDYVEKHHIIPKCMGGTNNKENMVSLSAREHFVCHQLLTKMALNKKHQYQLWNAFSCMLYRTNPHQDRIKISGRIFDNIKKEGSKIKSNAWSGENNPSFGKTGEKSPLYGRKQSKEHVENRRIAGTGITRSEESRKKQSASTKGVPKSEAHKESMRKSAHRGNNSVNADKKIYAYKNIKTNEVVTGTRYDFALPRGYSLDHMNKWIGEKPTSFQKGMGNPV